MSKNKHTPKNKSTVKIVIIVLLSVILLVALSIFVIPQLLYTLSGEADAVREEENIVAQESASAETKKTDTVNSNYDPASVVTFPLSLEDGKLELVNVFQFDGINPDCNNQESSDIASITLTNTSDTYLSNAEIVVIPSNGEEMHFQISDLPAGKTVMAFSLENVSYDASTSDFNVSCTAQFDAEASMNEEQISVSTVGTLVTLQNNTDTDLNDIVVYCRCSMGDQYFGGITYTYTVNNLPAYGTAEVDAVDCILGLAEVVRITIDHK